MPIVLPRDFYARPTLEVARDLIGKVLVRQRGATRTSGIIVEAEAYIGEDDPACHASSGRTRRNAPLYGPPGFAYVYFTYGMHFLVNAVTEDEGRPAAVLIRALEPLEGVGVMRRRRAIHGRGRRRALDEAALCRGPANLTRALAIDLRQNRLDLCDSALRIEDHGSGPRPLAWGPRIGIRVGTDRDWRVYVPGHPAVTASR
jgi:DNA-3-methyladenine glycosylase